MPLTKIKASNVDSLPAAAVQAHATDYDDNQLKEDIALVAFQAAAAGSFGKHNLVDQTIDSFEDATGIDASASTNEMRNSSKYYSSISSSTDAAAWVFGAQASGASYGTTIDSGGERNTIPFDSTSDANSANSYYDSSGEKWIGKDAGAGNTQTASNWSARGSTDHGFNNPWGNGNATINLQYSSDGSSWTTAVNQVSSGAPGTVGASFTETAGYRYWRVMFDDGGDMRVADFSLYGVKATEVINSSMTLVSNSTTAESAPTKGDIILTYSNGAGTASINVDISAEYSADNGSTWTPMTLVSQGTTGAHTILSAHDVALTSTSGTSMRYRIKTLNQSAAKETRIHAVSLGWS